MVLLIGHIPGELGALEIYVKRNGEPGEGVKLELGDGFKLADLLRKSTIKLQLTRQAKIAYYSNGLEVDDVGHIEDKETLHISLGEKFVPPTSSTGCEVIAGWSILEKLGEGGFGSVCKVQHTETGEVAAIKFISKKSFIDFDDLQRVFMEIQVLRDLNHSNIVRIIDVHDHPENVCFFMEYASAGQLREYVEKKGILAEDEARVMFGQISKAVHYCHGKNVVHRDLKLENILLDDKKNVKIVDFGLSDFVANSENLKTDAGTEAYLAPEVLSGNCIGHDVFKLDVWALGVILYIMVCGRFPFSKASKNVCRTLKNEGPTWPKAVDLSPPLKNLISRMLIPDSSLRTTLAEITNDPWLTASRFAAMNMSPLDEDEFAEQKTIPSPRKVRGSILNTSAGAKRTSMRTQLPEIVAAPARQSVVKPPPITVGKKPSPRPPPRQQDPGSKKTPRPPPSGRGGPKSARGESDITTSKVPTLPKTPRAQKV